MALTRPNRSNRPQDAPSALLSFGPLLDRKPLNALSQRKLNALASPLAYVDRLQRYRFANKAFLEWLDRRADEVMDREVIEVVGKDVYELYEAYVDAALGGERHGIRAPALRAGTPADLDPRRLSP